MGNSALEKLVWLLIYSGLLLVIVGLFVRQQAAGEGGLLIAAGVLDTALGLLAWWWRSRRRD